MSDQRPSVAMIFAAGRGRRMEPLSRVLPKPALPVPGGPVIAWPLRLADRFGIRSVVVNTWWLAPAMEAVARAARPPDVDLALSREEELMETAGGLALARDRGLLGEAGPVLVINGDCVSNLDLERVFERHAAGDDLVTLGLLPHLGPERWSRVLLDRQGRVEAIRPPGTPEAGEMPLLYPGVMLVAREAIEGLETVPSGVAPTLWWPAQDAGRLGGAVVTGHWREIGTPEDYLEGVVSLLGDRSEIDPSVRRDGSGTIERSLVDREVTIGAGAIVSESILGPGVSVGAGARVTRSVLFGGVAIGDGAVIVDACRVGDQG